MSQMLQVLAGEGPLAWDLTPVFRDVPTLNTLWRGPSLRKAANTIQAPPLPSVEGNPDLSQLCLHLATILLEKIPAPHRHDTAIILATTFGCLRTDIDFDLSRREANARYASPAAFRNTLPTHIPAELSVKLALRGPVFALTSLDPLTLALQRTIAWRHPLTLTGAFDHPPNAEPRALFLLLSHLA